MDRLAPHRPGIAFVGLLALVATSSCDQPETSGGVSRGGQGGRASMAGATAASEGGLLSVAGTAAIGAGGSQVGGAIGASGGGQFGAVGGGTLSASGGSGVAYGGTTGLGATGGIAAGGSAIAVGGGSQGGSNLGGSAQGGNAGGSTVAMGGNVATGGNVSKGGTAGSNASGAPSTAGMSAGGASGEVCLASRGNYCGCMPKFVGTQVVDGAGDEFSALAPMTFALSTATYVNPGRSSALPERVTLRAGWSDVALHAHVHVEDPAIIVDPSSTLWNGDNVQLFVAPTDNLTGTYTGTEDGGALHVLISAPDSADLSHATVIYQNGVSTNSPFVTGLFAGRRVTGGYEIEAQLQWLPIANPRRSGAGIGFDLLVGAASSSSQGLALEGGLANNPVTASSPACSLGGRVQPGCDDRTWCRPLLE